MGGGGKGRSTTTEVELPPGLDAAANEVLGAAFNAASLPYKPNRGVTIASFAPQETAAIRGASAMARAFGIAPGTGAGTKQELGIPRPSTTEGGISGYSTGALYDLMRSDSMQQEDIDERNILLGNMRTAADKVYKEGSAQNRGLPQRKG